MRKGGGGRGRKKAWLVYAHLVLFVDLGPRCRLKYEFCVLLIKPICIHPIKALMTNIQNGTNTLITCLLIRNRPGRQAREYNQ